MARRSFFLFLSFLILVVSLPSLNYSSASPPWYNSAWKYRKSHVINAQAGAGAGYQFLFTVYYGSGSDSEANVYLASQCQTDFDDIRFSDDDGVTMLDYFRVSYTASTSASFWVQVNDNLNSSSATIYIYYKNDECSTTSSRANTLWAYDYFDTDTWSYEETHGGFIDVGADTSQYVSSPSSISTRFPSSTAGGTGVYGQHIKDFTFPETQVKITWSLKDDYSGATANYWFKRFLVDTTQVYSLDCANDGVAWANLDYNLDTTAGTHTVKLRQFMNSAVSNFPNQIWFDNLIIRSYVSPEPTHGAWGSVEQIQFFVTLYHNAGGFVNLDGTKYDNGSIIGVSNATTIKLSAIVNGSSLYAWDNFTYGASHTHDNNFNYSVTANITFWCYFVETQYFYDLGYSEGYDAGYIDGFNDGNYTGFILGNSTGYILGYAIGYDDGYLAGSGSGGIDYTDQYISFGVSLICIVGGTLSLLIPWLGLGSLFIGLIMVPFLTDETLLRSLFIIAIIINIMFLIIGLMRKK